MNNLAMMVQSPKFDNPMDSYAKALSIKSMMGESEMNDLKTRQINQDYNDEQSLRDLTRQSGGDTQKLRDLTYQSGNYKQGMALDKAITEQKKSAAEFTKVDLENNFNKADQAARIWNGVTDQASYEMGKRIAQSKGIDISTLPAQYSPQVKSQHMGQALHIKDALSQALEERKLTETERNNKQQNYLTKRGQDMTDARKREELVGVDESFTPGAIENAAARYNIDGTLPPMGMGKSGALGRSAILNRAAELASENGISGDQQRINQIGNKANSTAMASLQKQQTMVGAFEKNFNKNADIALELSSKVDSTGIPMVNKWINAGKRSVSGDPNLSAYDQSIKSVVNEYSKIISGSMGNTAAAEGEIKKVESMLNSAQTPAQVSAVLGLMKRETQNRMAGFEEEKSALRDQMAGKRIDNTAPSSNGAVPGLPHGWSVQAH